MLGVFLRGSDSFATASKALSSLYKPTVVIYEIGSSVEFVLTLIFEFDKYVGLVE